MKRFTYTSEIDQWPITAYRWPLTGSLATVVISHGLAEHAKRYDRLAQLLNVSGFNVYAMDHRAHGETSGPAGLGDFGDGGWDALIDDIDQLIDICRRDSPDTPVFLLGHSMGAAAAQQLVQRSSEKLLGLVMSGTTLRNPGEEIPEYNAGFEPVRTPYDWLSRDQAEVDRYISDPLCGFEGQNIRNGMDRTDPRRVDRGRLRMIRGDLPVLLIAGDADSVNDQLRGIDYLESCWREAGIKNIDRQIYVGGRHEMFNETNRDEVCENMIVWLKKIVSDEA